MLKNKPFLVILTLILVLAGFAPAQNLNWNITGAGARAVGFGGAFIGVADDATSVVWNPGGLATLERPEVSVVTRIVMDSFEADYTDVANNTHHKITNTLSHFVFNFSSFAYPLTLGGKKLVLAAAYQRQLDFYSSQLNFESEGGVDTFTPGLGLRLFPVMSVGAAANIWFGSASGELKPTLSWDQDFSGFNLVFGALLDFNNLESPFPLKLGASLRTPFELEEKYAGGSTNKYEMPLMIGFGASLRLGENLTLAADYEMRMFGGSQVIPEMGNETPLSPSEEDLNQIRAGMEYLLITDLGIFPLRGGFQTVPTVFANYNKNTLVNGQYPPSDQVSGIGFAVGSGYIHERFALDVTYSMQQYEQENDPNQLIGTFKTVSSNITVSGIVYF